ncbi:MAG: GNAT family N-acetyltransferase [Candidatus Methanoperedens sp.]|nr:GNAT family N-acetyltransferase [Candidatus Methanoperedens sp.]
MKYEIHPFNSKDEKDWKEFIDNHKDATIFHSIEWKKVIEKTFGFRHEYLVVRDSDNNLVGISPAFNIRTFFGKVIISQPFFEYGGPIVDNQFNIAYEDILYYYKNRIDTDKLDYIELKAPPNCDYPNFDKIGYIRCFKAYDYYLNIKGKNFEKDIWQDLYTKKSRVRNSVRNAIKEGVRVEQAKNIDIYYDLYLKTMIKLGTPQMPKALYENIEKYTKVRFTFAYLKDIPIGGMMSFPFNNRDHMVGLVSDENYLNFRGNDMLYNEQIKYATNSGFDIIDFGRTRPNSDYERYKKKWGAIRVDMFSYFYPHSAGKNANPYKYYDLFSRFTKKVPWILTKIGPYIAKKFP